MAGCDTKGALPNARGQADSKRSTSPLTGLPLADLADAGRRAVAVKVENDPMARPQSGLDKAEVVYEEIVEGSVTRYVALYLDSQAQEIGPVRSVRPMDTLLLANIDPLLATSGGSPGVMQVLQDSGLNYVTEALNGACFYRARDRRAPHNLYTSTSRLRSACQQMGADNYFWTGDLFLFGEPVWGDKATSIRLSYPGACEVAYDYNAAIDKYLQRLAGQPRLDKVGGSQIAPSTVIVQYVALEDSGVRDMAGALSPDAVVTGSGDAVLFSGGRVTKAIWSRKSLTEKTVFLNEEGEEIPIRPGQVWIHLIPSSIRVSYS